MKHEKRSLEDGMVTVETAIGMAALIAVLALLVGAIGVVKTQADLCQAVREGARAASVGDSAPAAVTRSFPRAVDVSTSAADGWVSVTAGASVASVGTLSCSATTLLEPGAQR